MAESGGDATRKRKTARLLASIERLKLLLARASAVYKNDPMEEFQPTR
jgi:hypothetical protein